MIRFVMFVLAIGLSPLGAVAQSLEELRPDFIAGCVDGGNDAPICGCLFDNWRVNLPEDQHPLASTAITMFLGEMPQDPQKMMAATVLLQDMTSVLLQCASGELELSAQDAPPPIPQTGDTIEEQLLYARITGPSATIAEMNRYTALVEARKARERAAEQGAIAATESRADINRSALSADYEAELARIHGRDITAWEIDDFASLFDLYCRSGGGTEASCACAWPILAGLSKYNAVPYMASRSPGDDISSRLSAADYSAAPFTRSLFNERRAVCD